jgi:hypothetical protein
MPTLHDLCAAVLDDAVTAEEPNPTQALIGLQHRTIAYLEDRLAFCCDLLGFETELVLTDARADAEAEGQ